MAELRPCPYRIEDLMPHRPPMLLIDKVEGWDDENLVARVTIGPGSLFLEARGVPAHIGIEYMAQTCCAFAGLRSRQEGKTPRIGFLLGTRRYVMHRPWFLLGDSLTVTTTMLYRDDSMGNFAGRIAIDGALAAEGQLTVYQPPETLSPAQGTAA